MLVYQRAMEYEWGYIPGLVNIQKLLNMAIEIVDLPIKHGDFHSYVAVYQRVSMEDINRAGTMYRKHSSNLKTKVVLVVYSF